ncbi:hypothetical protein LINGRAHAP2_LOCUS32142 [Linum grandiflorum]
MNRSTSRVIMNVIV